MLQENCFSRNTLAEVEELIAERLREFAAGESLFLVAEVGGVVVGSATFQREAHHRRRHRAKLGGLVVSGEYQGRGIARRLVEALRDQAARWEIRILETSVRGGTPAEEVYRRLGFREYGRLPGGLLEPEGNLPILDEVFFWTPVTVEETAEEWLDGEAS
jgi:GNAT superfamily N-acetyltransferase